MTRTMFNSLITKAIMSQKLPLQVAAENLVATYDDRGVKVLMDALLNHARYLENKPSAVFEDKADASSLRGLASFIRDAVISEIK